MANVVGNNTYYIIAKQTVFGTAPTSLTGAMVLNEKCDFKVSPNMITRPVKSGTFEKITCESTLGSKELTVDMSGVLCSQYQTLLKAYFNKAASAYTVGNSSTADSYTIIRYYPGTVPKCEYAVGCSLNTLNITGTSRQDVKFSAQWTGKAFTEYGGTGSFTAVPANICGTPFVMNSVTFTASGIGSSTLTDFSINLTTDMVDDKYRYQNASTVLNNDFMSKNGSLNYTTIWDPTLDATMNAALGTYVSGASLALVNSSKTWTFAMKGKVEDYTKADPDKGTYEQAVTINTYYSGSAAGVTVTVA